jgi:thiol-disulfide isomerase/thioredoxin
MKADAQNPASAGGEAHPRGAQRATGVLFALSAVLILIFGLLYMVSSQQGRGGDISLISTKGERVNVAEHLSPGKYTVIDFYADWCANCKKVTPYLEQLARARPDVALRKVNIVDWDTPVVAQYRVTYLPYLQMYDPDGALIAEGADRVLAELRRRLGGG